MENTTAEAEDEKQRLARKFLEDLETLKQANQQGDLVPYSLLH
jgi:hypothetical protein